MSAVRTATTRLLLCSAVAGILITGDGIHDAAIAMLPIIIALGSIILSRPMFYALTALVLFLALPALAGGFSASVERYEIPGLRALNFILNDSLGGGGTASLLTDAQGKTHAMALLRMEVEVPDDYTPPTPAGGSALAPGGERAASSSRVSYEGPPFRAMPSESPNNSLSQRSAAPVVDVAPKVSAARGRPSCCTGGGTDSQAEVPR